MKISECIFSPELMQRHCAIITDSDMHVVGTEKSSEQGAKIGESQKEKLETLFATNPWVRTYYAPHTLEVDFAEIELNRSYVHEIIGKHYVQEATIEKHQANLLANRYDTVLTLAKDMGKGWYATVLASHI